MTEPLDDLSKTIIKLGRNRRLAHNVLFGHRHPQETPIFHYEVMDLWSSPAPLALVMAFRGAAKSTLAEEGITLSSLYREFHNCIILGETWSRACERLAVIKREIETNELIRYLFGDLVGPTWTEDKIVLATGQVIQAFGRGQSLRGSKHLDWRPDLVFGDDVEDEESCVDEDAINKTKRWWLNVVEPAMAPGYRARINGTPLHPRSMLMQLYEDPEWEHRKYPIERVNPETGEREATWPARFPLPAVDRLRARAERMGNMTGFNQEYMCEAENVAEKPFRAEMIRVEPRVRTWQATWAMYDPARTTGKTSATTGKVVWSWIGNKLVVWRAEGRFWQPSELIEDLFKTDDEFSPVSIYVEEDGLNEWLLQPIRSEQVKRNLLLPVVPVKAPKGKFDFIRQLQPFFKAGEISCVQDFPDLRSQLVSFPSGRIDVPNALAYALRLRPGAPVYEEFTVQHIVEDMPGVPRVPVWLAINATVQHTTGVLMQFVNGALHILADYAREGDPGAELAGVLADASVFVGRGLHVYAPPMHFSDYDTLGLRAAAARIPVDVRQSGPTVNGRDQLRALLSQATRTLKVSSNARWTLNALSGGYCYEITKHGTLSDFTVKGVYRTLMEGLESVVGLMQIAGEDDERRFATTATGVRHLTALATGETLRPSKSDWGTLLSDVKR